MNKVFALFCFFSISFIGFAQKSNTPIDTIAKSTEHSPKTATIMSAACPGLGQIYNKSYWKVPVIYGGFAFLGYNAVQTGKKYKEFQKVYDNYRKPFLTSGTIPNSDTTTLVVYGIKYSPTNVQQGRDYYRRARDLYIIGIGGVYILNIIEAYVDAHMFSFDIGDDLSFHIEPMYYTSQFAPSGLKVNVTF